MNISIDSKYPFNLKTVVTSHGWCQVKPFHWREEEEILEYTLQLSHGKVIKLEITGFPGGLYFETIRLSDQEKKEVEGRLHWMFGLDIDLSSFYQSIKGNLQLSHVEKDSKGRILRSPTFFEDVVRTILTTNTLWSATIRMTANLVEQYGEAVSEGSEQKAFPSPVCLAQASEEQLRKETRLGYRAPYILNLAKQVESKDLDLESYKTSDFETSDLRKELLKIQGVGPYAAANLLMILGRSDFLPIDSWALKVVSHEWFDGETITPSHVQEAFEEWGQWKGLVFWFWDWKLFHADETK